MTLFASVSREDIIHLCVFLAGYQAKLQDLRGACMSMVGEEKAKAWETVIYHWPVIQGTCNQIHLLRIGELEYDPAAVARAIKGAGGPAAELAFQKASDQTLPTTTDYHRLGRWFCCNVAFVSWHKHWKGIYLHFLPRYCVRLFLWGCDWHRKNPLVHLSNDK